MSAEEAPAEEGLSARISAALRCEWPTVAIATAGVLAAVAAPHFAVAGLLVSLLALAARLLLKAPAAPPSAQPVPETQKAVEVSNQISALDLAAAVPDPLIIFEPSSAIAYANEAARQAFGPLHEGMSLLLKFRAPEVQEMIGSIVAGHAGPLAAEYSERVPIEATYRITGGSVGSSGELFFLLFKDQSESRRIDRMRADFIANASHELRTPLASISGFVETLLGPAKEDPAARERFLKIMQDQTGRMSRLIDDLLSLSRIEMRSHGKPTASVDLRQVLDSVLDTLKPLAAGLSVAIETDIRAEEAIVPGDRDELFQVLANLIENACKYGRTGGRVVVSMASAGAPPHREICVTVRDFGPGIPEEHIPRITERFYRVDIETSRSQKGTGLGLAIVKHILTRHNGRLVVSSELGVGSQFAVYLPAK